MAYLNAIIEVDYDAQRGYVVSVCLLGKLAPPLFWPIF
jgi:hypothetical protein